MPALSQSLEFNTRGTSTVAVIYPNTATTMMTYYSDRVKGDGYYGSSDGIHTVAYTAAPTFIGTVSIQASLATDPASTDWFVVNNTTVNYTEFDDRNTATVDCYNFAGNFVWVRGRVEIVDGAVEVIHYNH
jgi:hypothetical protein